MWLWVVLAFVIGVWFGARIWTTVARSFLGNNPDGVLDKLGYEQLKKLEARVSAEIAKRRA
jgi:hypothetical protein